MAGPVRGGAEGADAASRGGGCSLAAVELLDWRLLLLVLLPLAVAVLELAVRSGGRVGGAGLELGVERVEEAALVVADEAAEAWLSVLRRGSMLLGNGAGERDGQHHAAGRGARTSDGHAPAVRQSGLTSSVSVPV